MTMNKTGATLILTGANAYTGPTTISAGTLQLGDGVNANSSLGSGAITVSGTGVFALDLPTGSTFNRNVALGATGATFKTIQSGTTTVSGIISGAGGFTQAGTGTTIVTSTNTYTGATNVSAGTLQMDGGLSGSGAVGVAAGGTLSGTGTIAGAVTVLAGGTLSPGDSGPNPGTLDLSKLTLSAGSISDFRLNTATTAGNGVNDLVNVSGNLTIAGTLNITQLVNLSVGSYTLFTYGGTLTNTGFTAINGTGGFDAVISTGTAHQVNLIISATGMQFWDGTGAPNNGIISGGSGTWNGTAMNWTNTVSGSTNGTWARGTAVFGSGVGGTVMVGAPINVQGLIFAVTGYTLSGSATARHEPRGHADRRPGDQREQRGDQRDHRSDHRRQRRPGRQRFWHSHPDQRGQYLYRRDLHHQRHGASRLERGWFHWWRDGQRERWDARCGQYPQQHAEQRGDQRRRECHRDFAHQFDLEQHPLRGLERWNHRDPGPHAERHGHDYPDQRQQHLQRSNHGEQRRPADWHDYRRRLDRIRQRGECGCRDYPVGGERQRRSQLAMPSVTG